MSITLTALIAAALYQSRSEQVDPASLDQALALLADTTRRSRVHLERRNGDIRVNDARVATDVPGAALVRQALMNHSTGRLLLPVGLTVDQWRVVVELFGSAAGLYGSVDNVRDTLRISIPDANVTATVDDEANLHEAMFELPGLRATSGSAANWNGSTPRAAELEQLSQMLDPLLEQAEQAALHRQHESLADALIRIRELETTTGTDGQAIVTRERRRVAPSQLLNALARQIPRPGASPVFGRLFTVLGHDGAVALIDALGGAPGAQGRRRYIDLLSTAPGADDAVLAALRPDRGALARDLAQVAGRRQLTRAVPMLTQLLKHQQVEVRTSAWHALEQIGSTEAVKVLRS